MADIDKNESKTSDRGETIPGNLNIDTISGILDLRKEYSQPDWDGYGADPVGERSVKSSVFLVGSLVDFSLKPDVGVDPDGFVTIEWCKDKGNQILLAVSDNGKVFLNSISGGNSRSHLTLDISENSVREISSRLDGFGVFSPREETP